MINQNILNLLDAGNHRAAARRLTKLLPRDVGGSVHYHLGLCYFFLGELERSHALVIQSLKAAPNNPDYLNALALVNEARGQLADALVSAELASSLGPNIPDFKNTKAKVLLSLNRETEATEILEPLVLSNPRYLEAVLNLAACYAKLERHLDLIRLLDKDDYKDLPDHRPYYWLAIALSNVGDSSKSGKLLGTYLKRKYSQEYANRPDLLGAFVSGFEGLIAGTPSYFETESDIAESKFRFENAIAELRKPLLDNLVGLADSQLVLDAFFKITNFYLPYQQGDDVEPNTDYANLVRQYLERIGVNIDGIRQRRSDGPIRAGIVSENFGLHITTWTLDWADLLLDRLGAELFVYSLNHSPGAGVLHHLKARASVVSLVVTENTFESAIDTIREDNLDLMFYPDVGMCPSSRMLSMVRLARHQAVHWGHPVTTGSPAIDYFVSGTLMEPTRGALNYSERLIRLPALGAAFRREEELPTLLSREKVTSRESEGEDRDSYDFCSVQSLFKHLPQYDDWYLQILSLTGESTLGFLWADSDASNRFFNRLRVKADKAGIDRERIRMVARRPHAEFLELLKRISLCMDAPGWSGGNTTLNCFGVGTPVLTIEMEKMRSNHTAAMYRRMGLDYLVAKSRERYIDLASQWILDEKFRSKALFEIRERQTMLYEHGVMNRAVGRLLALLK